MSQVIRALLVALAIGAAVVPLPASWVERVYSQQFYLGLQRVVTPLSNLASFAWFDWFLVLGLAGIVSSCVAVFRRRRGQGIRPASASAALHAAACGATVYLAFLMMWGLNYRREPLTSRLDYSARKVTREAAESLWAETAGRAAALHDEVHRRGFAEWRDVPAQLTGPFQAAQRSLADVTPAVPGRAKWSALNLFFGRAGVDGMTDPFFLEVLVNRSLLPFERPMVLAHEWGHLAGYASEAEANFFAWIVCLQGPPAAEYSARVSLLWELAGALPRDEAASRLRQLAPGVRNDLRAIAQRVSHATPVVRDVSWQVYDRYLKANRVEQGVQDYGLGLRLMLGTSFGERWAPRRRATGE